MDLLNHWRHSGDITQESSLPYRIRAVPKWPGGPATPYEYPLCRLWVFVTFLFKKFFQEVNSFSFSLLSFHMQSWVQLHNLWSLSLSITFLPFLKSKLQHRTHVTLSASCVGPQAVQHAFFWSVMDSASTEHNNLHLYKSCAKLSS